MRWSTVLMSCLLCSVALSSISHAESTTEQQPAAEADSLPGHMQPLGSHMEPRLVTRINYMPTPQEFNDKFVSPKQPVIFEGLMSNENVLANWQSDDYLRTHFGDDVMGMEEGKKENRSLYGFEMPISDFLDIYKEESVYMVSDLSPGMYNEWRVPKFLLCGGYADKIAMVFVWFSSGGTKSVLHTDTQENLHCLVSGTKKFVMFKPFFAEAIGPEHSKQGFYNIDVERVNMTAYRNLTKIPWYLATLKAGDCLYLPYLWIHHVESTGRNMGINIWWSMFDFDSEDCPSDANELPKFAPLSDFDLEFAAQLRKMIKAAEREDGYVFAIDVLDQSERLQKEGVQVEHIEDIFEMLEPGSNGVLTDVNNIPKEALRKGALYLADYFNHHINSEDDMSPLEDYTEENSMPEQEEDHSQQERDEL